VILTKEIKTAGKPAKILLTADRNAISADGDLSFITVKVVDKDGVLVPDADNLVKFQVSGPGFVAGVDNGSETSLEPFKANYRKAFNGMCLAIIQSKEAAGKVTVKATSEGLADASVTIETK
ncbi:MAG: glycoside hydrolase family 2, partial [Blastocatellia bacterium]